MANIEPGLPCAIIGEGAAVRLGAEAGQDASETHVYFEPCEENKAVTVAESQHNEDGAGRVLDVNLVLRNVCPGRRVAVGVTLHEVDGTGGEHSRGFHAMTVPAHRDGPRDVTLPRIRFVLPEDLRIEGADGPPRLPASLCGAHQQPLCGQHRESVTLSAVHTLPDA